MTSNDGTQEALAQLAHAAVLIGNATATLAAAEPAPGHAAYFAWLVEQTGQRLTRAQVHAADALRRSGAHQLDEESHQAIRDAGLRPTEDDLAATAGRLTSGRAYYKDAVGLMKERLNISAHVAKARLTHAESLIAEVSDAGERLRPRYPQLAEEFQRSDTEPGLVLGAATQLRKAEPDLVQAPDPGAARAALESDAIALIRHEPSTARRHLSRMIEQEVGENRPLAALLAEVGLYRSGLRRGLVHYRLTMLPQDAELIESMCAQIDNPQGIAGNREELMRLVAGQYLAGTRGASGQDAGQMPEWAQPQLPEPTADGDGTGDGSGVNEPDVPKRQATPREHDRSLPVGNDESGMREPPPGAVEQASATDPADSSRERGTGNSEPVAESGEAAAEPDGERGALGGLDTQPVACGGEPDEDGARPHALEAGPPVGAEDHDLPTSAGGISAGQRRQDPWGSRAADPVPPELGLPFEELRPEFRHLTALISILKSGGATEGRQAGLVQPQVTVVLDYFKMLETGRNFAVTEGGLPLAAGAARTMLCNGNILPVVLGGGSKVMDIGRESRFFKKHQRKALQAIYRGCAYPGCTMPASRCEADHIRPWEEGGPTSVENGMLLCPMHHHARHCGLFSVIVNEDGPPRIRLPKNLDPHQRPRLNTYWYSPSEAIEAARAAQGADGAA